MGLGGISIWQLLIILLIVVLLFGTKRLRGLGSDIGSAIKGFRKSVSDDKEEANTEDKKLEADSNHNTTTETANTKSEQK